jgi:hypothetical protein
MTAERESRSLGCARDDKLAEGVGGGNGSLRSWESRHFDFGGSADFGAEDYAESALVGVVAEIGLEFASATTEERFFPPRPGARRYKQGACGGKCRAAPLRMTGCVGGLYVGPKGPNP